MTMDQQAAMERLQDLYREKNEYLEEFLEWITPYEFYREVFPVGSFERRGHFEDAKGNGIAVTIPKGKAGAGGDGVTGVALEIEGNGKAKRYRRAGRVGTASGYGFYYYVSYFLLWPAAEWQECQVSLCLGV